MQKRRSPLSRARSREREMSVSRGAPAFVVERARVRRESRVRTRIRNRGGGPVTTRGDFREIVSRGGRGGVGGGRRAGRVRAGDAKSSAAEMVGRPPPRRAMRVKMAVPTGRTRLPLRGRRWTRREAGELGRDKPGLDAWRIRRLAHTTLGGLVVLPRALSTPRMPAPDDLDRSPFRVSSSDGK